MTCPTYSQQLLLSKLFSISSPLNIPNSDQLSSFQNPVERRAASENEATIIDMKSTTTVTPDSSSCVSPTSVSSSSPMAFTIPPLLFRPFGVPQNSMPPQNIPSSFSIENILGPSFGVQRVARAAQAAWAVQNTAAQILRAAAVAHGAAGMFSTAATSPVDLSSSSSRTISSSSKEIQLSKRSNNFDVEETDDDVDVDIDIDDDEKSSDIKKKISVDPLDADDGLNCAETDTEIPPGMVRGPNGQLWPAWVFCTRYSDRPSSGPRARKIRRTDRPLSDEKRPRTAFTSEQLSRLRREFESNQYLTEDRRKKLSCELGLNETQIKIWFQNKRAKLKKGTGGKGGLAKMLAAQGLYNHATVSVEEAEAEEAAYFRASAVVSGGPQLAAT